MYFHQGLIVYGGIVLKMNNFHLFEKVLKYFLHIGGNGIYKQHGFFSYIYVCVDVVVDFVMGLVIMVHHKKSTCLKTIQFLHLCPLHT
jgi:hypothetical protein